MFLASFEPGKEMAIANFFLAIFVLFTFAVPLLLITRGDKTEANREFITATVNPWFQIKENKALPAKVDLSAINPTEETVVKSKSTYEVNLLSNSATEGRISLQNESSQEFEEITMQELETKDECLAA